MKKPLLMDKVIHITLAPDGLGLDMVKANNELLFEDLEVGAYHIITPIMKMDDGNVLVGNQQLLKIE